MLRLRASPAAAPRAAFLGHSLGTALLASLVKASPRLVAASLLADPICFLLYQRDVVHNFLYRTPKPIKHLLKAKKGAHHIGYWFRLVLHYVLRQDPTIQSCFRREFWWPPAMQISRPPPLE